MSNRHVESIVSHGQRLYLVVDNQTGHAIAAATTYQVAARHAGLSRKIWERG